MDSQVPLYAMLTMDSRKLLLPQAEIRILEPVVDIDSESKLPGTVGWIEFQDEQWPVYCMRQDLNTLDEIPKTRRVCVLLDSGRGYLGLVCDQIETIQRDHLRFYPLPACMQKSGSPIPNLAILDGNEVGCVTTTLQLAAFLAHSDNLERLHA